MYRGLARLIQERSKVKARDAAFQIERAAIRNRENGKDDGTAYQDWRACDTLPYRKNRECQSMQERVPAEMDRLEASQSRGTQGPNLTLVPQKGT